jgi:hypothetical protein
MKKTDKSIHSICIASIKRKTFKPYNYTWTRFYESNSDFPHSQFHLNLTQNELIICSTIIDSDNYSILTTQKLITNENGIKSIGDLNDSTLKPHGDFKGLDGKLFIFGVLKLKNEMELKCFIETGKASMIMIHGIRTLIQTQQMTIKNIENVTRVWSKENKN